MKYIRNLALCLLLAGPHPLLAPPDPNTFANNYNYWIKLQLATQPGTINATELHAWQQVKKEWPEFRRMIDARY